jgi:hypothetical protein
MRCFSGFVVHLHSFGNQWIKAVQNESGFAKYGFLAVLTGMSGSDLFFLGDKIVPWRVSLLSGGCRGIFASGCSELVKRRFGFLLRAKYGFETLGTSPEAVS